MMRSLLFVPGDSEKKLEKGLSSGADALIVDLEDSVAPDRKRAAREIAAAFIIQYRRKPGSPRLLLRVNSLVSGLIDADLDAVISSHPDAVMLPKAEGGQSIQHLSAKIAVREAEGGLPDGAIEIVAIATETGRAIFQLGTYGGSSRRLSGLTWGAEDLSADIGAETNRLTDGAYTDPYRLARALTLMGAAAAEVDAIDTVFTSYRDDAALREECEAARRDGFVGKMAIHPAQVPIINEVFTPSPDVIAKARAILSAFDAVPGVGVIGLNGEMLDMPHLRRAERLLRHIGG